LRRKGLWSDLQYDPSTAFGREGHDTKIETLEFVPAANRGHGNYNNYCVEKSYNKKIILHFKSNFGSILKTIAPLHAMKA
jgi:hypothetical protein